MIRIRRRPQVSAVADEFEDVWLDDEDGLESIGESQRDNAVEPNVAAVNILARGEIVGENVDHVTC